MELEEKLKNLKGMLAHSNPGISMAELLDKLCELGRKEWSKVEQNAEIKARKSVSYGSKDMGKTHRAENTESNSESSLKNMGQNVTKAAAPRKAPPMSKAAIVREVWRRDKACTNCGSTYALEIDHKLPRALGGDDSLENLRLLCRSCNQRAAIEVYGARKMESYLKGSNNHRRE
jgi:hypothetical protein